MMVRLNNQKDIEETIPTIENSQEEFLFIRGSIKKATKHA
jgi:hypothetical protein